MSFIRRACLFASCYFASYVLSQTNTDGSYDYIVVGSGPGGAPVAAQLAQNGYSVLLMDAGDDQRSNTNTSVSIVLADVAAEDEKLRWDFFVRYHQDDELAYSNDYFTWRTPDGEHYVGTDAPEGSEALGMYYPRSGTLGGCSAHNAGAAFIPSDSYWDYLVEITGDDSWGAASMRQYFTQFEQNTYLPEDTPGHGFNGWLQTSARSIIDAYGDQPERMSIFRQIARAFDGEAGELVERTRTDPNSVSQVREQNEGIFAFPFHNSPLGNRTNANNLLDRVLSDPANNLTIQL